MPQATDIVLDGAGYMLAPGKSAYKRTQDGIAEGRTGRVQMKDFFGGQIRPYQLERDRFWRGSNVGPADNGQAVRPWVAYTDYTLHASLTTPNVNNPFPSAVVNDHIYVANGTAVMRPTNIGNISWGGFAAVDTAPATVTSLAFYNGRIMIGMGAASDIRLVNYPSGGSPAALYATERGSWLTSYAGFAIWQDASAAAGTETNRVRMGQGSSIDTRYLDNKIMGMTSADACVWAITRSSLYRFTGRVKFVMIANPAYTVGGTVPASIPGNEWSGEWEPFFQHGTATSNNDHKFLLGFGGRLYTNIGQFIAEFRPDSDRAGWKDTGLHYANIYGACVASGYLIVCIQSMDDRYQVWAWDGSGWWIVFDKGNDAAPYCFPIAVHGIGGFDLMVFFHNSTSYRLVRLIQKSQIQNTIPPSGNANFVTSMIDANDRDKDKAWRKVGCVFADPDPSVITSADAISVTLQYSIDAGQSWTNAASASPTGNSPANHQIVLNGDISSAAAVSRFLMLRVLWAGLVDWAPQLVDLWAEFELLDSPARRRKWMLHVQASDQVINRDSGVLALTGRQLINSLWTSWQTGTTITFRDIDYDDVAIQRNVRIIGIEEDTERPADAGRWGQSTVKLVLVEV